MPAKSTRNRIAQAMFNLVDSVQPVRRHPRRSASWQLYSVRYGEEKEARGINLLDYGCVRIFTPKFACAIVDLYEGLLHKDFTRTVHAYETWGFRGLTKDLVEALNIWAGFIYAPLLDDRVRSVADGVAPATLWPQGNFRCPPGLEKRGPVLVPREFVFMDRAAIGLGGAFLHLDARLNFFQLFHETMGKFSAAAVSERQTGALAKVGLPPPA